MPSATPTAAEISLREHVDQRFMDFDRRLTEGRTADRDRVQLALTAAKEAVDKAEQANERRLSLLNEFRSQQADEARKYVPREMFDLAVGQMLNRLALLETAGARGAGQDAGLAKFWTTIVSVVSVIGIIATIVISTLLRSV